MGKLLQLAIYNPSVINDEDFLKGFVARHNEAKHIIKSLGECSDTGPATHQLIFGQRGMGKSTMLRKVALAVENDPELNERFIPLGFREEQYNVHNLETFWQNCVDSLGDWFERTEQLLKLQNLDDFVLASDPSDLDYYKYFKETVASEGKRPLLLIDNFDLVVDSLPADESWAFRRILQEPNGIVVVGAAAAYMEAFSNQDLPFFDFFQVTVLEKLRPNELMRCLTRLAELRGEGGQNVLNLIENDIGRVKALFELTGGNPRTLTLLYVLLEADEVGDVFSDLESLLDQVTGLYKSRVEDLAPQARLIIDGLALQWNPCTAAELSDVTGLATNKVSSQLDRMVGDGLIEKVRKSGTKKKAYQIAERFFNIWYLMRHAPRRQRMRLKWLVNFLQIFYSTQQLTDKAVSILQNEASESNDLLFAVGGAIGDPAWQQLIELETNGSASASAAQTDEDICETPTTAIDWMAHGRLLGERLGKHDQAISSFEKAKDDPDLAAEANWRIGNVYKFAKSDLESAKSSYEASLLADPDFARANYSLGTLLANTDDWGDAERYLKLAASNQATKYSGSMALAGLYQYRKHDIELAEKHYRKAISTNKTQVNALAALGNLLVDEDGKLDEGIVLLKKAQKGAPDWSYPTWRLGDATFFKKRNFEHGLELLRKARQQSPHNEYILSSLCQALALVPARWDEARSALEELVEAKSTLFARSLLADFLLTAVGDVESARIEFEKILRGEAVDAADYATRGYVKMYHYNDVSGAKIDFDQALILNGTEQKAAREVLDDDLAIRSNLLVISAFSKTRVNDFQHSYDAIISQHSKTGKLLLDSIVELSKDNFGASFDSFRAAIELNSYQLYEVYKGFLVFYLRQIEEKGYGEMLVEKLQESKISEKYWPIFSAFDAFFNGEEKLLDVNPEVRGAASQMYNWLSGLDNAGSSEEPDQ